MSAMVVSDNAVKGSFQLGPTYILLFSINIAVSRISGLGAELMQKETIGTFMVGDGLVMTGHAISQSVSEETKRT